MIFLLACVELPVQPSDPPALLADAGPDRTAPVGVSVKLDGSASAGATFRWDTGDGRTYLEPSPAVVYSEPGLYTANLTVTGSDGSTVSDTATFTIHPRLAATPSHSSSTITVDAEGTVHAIVADSNTRVRYDGELRLLHACQGHPVGITATATLCDNPPELVQHNEEGVLLPPGSRPTGLVSPGSADVVTLRGTHELWINGAVQDSLIDGGSVVWLQGSATVARFRSNGEHGEVGEHRLAFDTGPDTDTGSRGVPNLLTLAASPDGQTVFVGGTLANVARGGFRDGNPLTFETSVRGFFAVLNGTGEVYRRQFDNQGRVGSMAVDPFGSRVFVAFPSTRTILVVDPTTGNIINSLLDVGHGVSGLAISNDGNTLYVNAELSRELRAYDVAPANGSPDLLWTQSTVLVEPLAPEVLAGKRLFHDSTRALAKHGYIACETCHPGGDHDGQTWDFTARGEGLRNTTSLLGRAGMGMGPVHWSGNFDEIQDFEHDIRGPFQGEGLMTDADFAAANTPLGPAKAGRSEGLDALAAYVTSLQATPISPFEEPEHGAEAFAAAGCEGCHPPPLYTDSKLDVRHDIGSILPSSGQRLGGPLDGLDTPTLLGTWDSRPWLHDGSAATLRQAIQAHDHTPTGVELDLIVDFTRSL